MKCGQMQIRESVFNACERNGTVMPFPEGEKYICGQISAWNQKLDTVVSRVYLGFEFCEKMFLDSDSKESVRLAQRLKELGYRISFVFPIMHEKNVSLSKKYIEKLEGTHLFDEWIVNDLGTLIMFRREINTESDVVLGRLFDKVMREPRIDLFENRQIRTHFDLLQPRDWSSSYNQYFVSEFGVKAAETDTLPDGVLNLEACTFPYHVHYPDIYISSAAYCEWTGLEPAGAFSLHGACSKKCQDYFQLIPNGNRQPLKKVGNVIYAVQQKSFDECVQGSCRLVISKR